MHTTVYIATSLDGFIARKDGNLDWLLNIDNPTHDDYGFAEFLRTIDAVVIGRGTFETVLAYPQWPYSPPLFVLSSTMRTLPPNVKGETTLLSLSPADLVRFLEDKGYRRIYVDGGKTIQNFLRDDLVDEMVLTKVPILIGSGIPLFDSLEHDLKFIHLNTKTYPNGLVRSTYRRTRE